LGITVSDETFLDVYYFEYFVLMIGMRISCARWVLGDFVGVPMLTHFVVSRVAALQARENNLAMTIELYRYQDQVAPVLEQVKQRATDS
jgi:hypothetical protein